MSMCIGGSPWAMPESGRLVERLARSSAESGSEMVEHGDGEERELFKFLSPVFVSVRWRPEGPSLAAVSLG